MVRIFAVGQGGNAPVVAPGGTGGVGGGSGAQSVLLAPAAYLPDLLHISTGPGGAGTATPTIVAIRPCGATFSSIPLAQDTLLVAGGAIGNAVTAGAVGSLATAILSGLGQAQFSTGTAGGAVATAVAWPTTGRLVCGGGGGGSSGMPGSNGGGITGTARRPFILPAGGIGSVTSGVAGTCGGSGYTSVPDMFFTGGAGGGGGYTTVASSGGAGGNGGWGCGGGGGGGAPTGLSTGTPGKGGPGFVIITCW